MTQNDKPVPSCPRAGPTGPGRRVVTGVDANGKSTVVLDGLVPPGARFNSPGAIGHAMWRTAPGPVDLTDGTDPMELFSLENDWYPPPGGTGAVLITWESGFEYPMHATDTLDVVFIVSGRVELVLESGATMLGPGECVVQRGTAHGWRVVGDEPLTLCAFGLGTERTGDSAS